MTPDQPDEPSPQRVDWLGVGIIAIAILLGSAVGSFLVGIIVIAILW